MWITDLSDWFLKLVENLWTDLTNFLNDLWVLIAEAVMMPIADLIYNLPAPAFLETHKLQNLFNIFPNDVLYFLSFLNLGESLSLISAALVFRMIRKLLTFFQW